MKSRNKIFMSAAVFTLLALTSSPLHAAAEVEGNGAQDYADIIANYGIGSSQIVNDLQCVAGHNAWGGYTTFLYSDGHGWMKNTSSDGTVSYSYIDNCYWNVTSGYVGMINNGYYRYGFDGAYYEATVEYYFSNSTANNSVVQENSVTYTPTIYYVSGSTFAEIGEDLDNQVNPPVTEATTSDSSSFQLPDSWISGGHNLPSEEDSPFDNDALDLVFQDDEDFWDLQFTSFTDLIASNTFGSCIGLFWTIIQNTMDSMDIEPLVIGVLWLGLFAWFLHR